MTSQRRRTGTGQGPRQGLGQAPFAATHRQGAGALRCEADEGRASGTGEGSSARPGVTGHCQEKFVAVTTGECCGLLVGRGQGCC